MGPDQIPTKLLKLTALLIHAPLTKLFNKSLAAGIFLDCCKKAYITPIQKKTLGHCKTLPNIVPSVFCGAYQRSGIFCRLIPYNREPASVRQAKRVHVGTRHPAPTYIFNPHRHTPFRHPRRHKGGGWYEPPFALPT